MTSSNTFQIENDLNKSKTGEIVNAILQMDSTNSPGQAVKIMTRSMIGTLHNTLEIVSVAHSAINVDLITEATGDNGPSGAIVSAAGKPNFRMARLGTTFNLSANGPYPPATKASALSSDDMVIYQTLSELTGRRKAILDYIVSGEKLSASDAKRCGIVDGVAQFKNKYSKKNVPTSVVPVPVTPAQIASAPVVPIAATQQPAPIQTDAVVPPTPKRRGRSKDTPTALAVA